MRVVFLAIFTPLLFGQIDYNNQVVHTPSISVRQAPYYAKGDGTTNDTVALNAALAAACSTSSSLILPYGTYIIAPVTRSSPILTSCSNLVISGPGTIKVANGAGSYYSIFGTVGNPISNFTLQNITINQNSANNPLVSSGDLTTYPRIILHTGNGGTNNVVSNVRITDVRCIWAFLIASTNSKIINTTADNVGGGTVAADSSLYYVANSGGGTVVSGNSITAVAPNTNMAVTAFETHAPAVVSDNFVLNMTSAGNFVGDSVSTTAGVSVTGNTFKGMLNCPSLWAQNIAGTPNPALSDVVVSDNICVVNQTQYVSQVYAGSGYTLNSASNLNFENIKINNNLVVFDLDNTTSDPINATANIGLGWFDASGTAGCTNCEFSSNTIVNSPSAAAFYQGRGSNIIFDNETIINPGSSPNAGLSAPYRAGIFIGSDGAVIGGTVSIKGGTISDALSTCRIGYGIQLSTINTSGIVVDGTSISTTDATCASLVNAIQPNTGSQLPIIRATVNVPTAKALPSNAVAHQSTVYSIQDALLYSFNGSSWGALIPHVGVPTPSAGCGTTPTVTGTDRGGLVILGSAPSGTCTLTFTLAFSNLPIYSGGQVTNPGAGGGGALVVVPWAASTSAIGFSVITGLVAGSQITWSFPLAN